MSPAATATTWSAPSSAGCTRSRASTLASRSQSFATRDNPRHLVDPRHLVAKLPLRDPSAEALLPESAGRSTLKTRASSRAAGGDGDAMTRPSCAHCTRSRASTLASRSQSFATRGSPRHLVAAGIAVPHALAPGRGRHSAPPRPGTWSRSSCFATRARKLCFPSQLDGTRT